MSFKLGNTNIGELYIGSNKIAQAYLGSNLVYKASAPIDPLNPLNLPPNTVRVRTSDGNPPNKIGSTSYETATLVPGTSDIYDVFKDSQSFASLLANSTNVIEVLGANTTGITEMNNMFYNCNSLTTVPLFETSNVTNMGSMFYRCTPLTSVPLFNTSKVTNMNSMFRDDSNLTSVSLFDTSNVTNMGAMFNNCTSLLTIPLFNTSKVTNMGSMFYNCTSVQSGALALYKQASTQANPPSSHRLTFRHCGSNTTAGAAELAQIPSGWK